LNQSTAIFIDISVTIGRGATPEGTSWQYRKVILQQREPDYPGTSDTVYLTLIQHKNKTKETI
jgi:hypothetical protein